MADVVRPPKDSVLDWNDLYALARADFGVFVLLTFGVLHPGQSLVPAQYVDLIVEVLTGASTSEPKRVIINLPPGYMKSLLVSVMYTAWRLGRNPSERIICISYGDDLTHELSRKTRKLMLSELYWRIFPNTVVDRKAEDAITTTKGGQRYATSVGSDIAGFRADLIVIDDPMQPAEAASELAKQKLRDWYDGVVAQRLLDQTTGVIILVMHRLAPDDLTATFVETSEWFHLTLPLIAEQEEIVEDDRGRVIFHRRPGDPLNETRAPREVCEQLRKSLPPHIFDAQCQQRPRYGGSGLCDMTRLARHNSDSQYELTIQSWDVAATKAGGDWTVCLKFGLTWDPRLGDVLDVIGLCRIRVELPDVRQAMITQDKVDKPALVVMDGNGIGLGVYQDLKNTGMRHLVRGDAMGKVNAANLKSERFRRGLMNLYDGRVRIPTSMPGLEILLGEFAAFPDGKNDDIVDSLSTVAAHFEYVIKLARRAARGERI